MSLELLCLEYNLSGNVYRKFSHLIKQYSMCLSVLEQCGLIKTLTNIIV